jgi:hypothetical protein
LYVSIHKLHEMKSEQAVLPNPCLEEEEEEEDVSIHDLRAVTAQSV